MIENIDHIGIAVKDLEATLKFYEQVLGMKGGEKWITAPVVELS